MKTILLIEDSGSLKKTFDVSIEEKEWEIITPKENITSMKWIFENIPDIIIADLTAINSSKVELLLYLNNEFVSTIPLLLITSSRKIVSSEFYKGFKYYLMKPYKTGQLVKMIKEILRNTEMKNPW